MSRLKGSWDEGEKAYKSPAWLIRFNTVDSFQGWEADLVLLSMRNVNKTGFMDSPNRLNVASTRGRELLIVFGHRAYYLTCRKSGEPCAALNEFAKRSPLLP
jgi:superfamily I DNA and/or RNA helicase